MAEIQAEMLVGANEQRDPESRVKTIGKDLGLLGQPAELLGSGYALPELRAQSAGFRDRGVGVR
jgi:hypothetical protein